MLFREGSHAQPSVGVRCRPLESCSTRTPRIEALRLIALVTAHFAIAMLSPALTRVLGRRVFLALATVPLATLVWALAQTARIRDGGSVTSVIEWLPSLRFEIALQDRKSTRLNPVTNPHTVCRLLLEQNN